MSRKGTSGDGAVMQSIERAVPDAMGGTTDDAMR